LLRTETTTVDPCDAITAEQRDFADSIVRGRTPLVSGGDGLEAVRIAERVVNELRKKQEADEVSKNIVRPPQWHFTVDDAPPRREAG
jgi:predicted dehydrogenase